MALSVAQRDPSSGLQEQTGGVTSDTLSLTSVSAGSLLVVTASFWDDTQTLPSVSDTVNGGWTEIVFVSETYDGSNTIIAYYENSASGSPTITIDWGSTTVYPNIAALEITGAATSSALDQTGTNSDSSAGSDTVTVSTSGALASGNQIVITTAAIEGTGYSWTTPTNYTEIGNNPDWDTVACQHSYDILSGGSTESVTWSGVSPNAFAANIATFKESAAGPVVGTITFSTDADASLVNTKDTPGLLSFNISSTISSYNDAIRSGEITFPISAEISGNYAGVVDGIITFSIDSALIIDENAAREGVISFPINLDMTADAPITPKAWVPQTRLSLAIYKYLLTR